MPQWLLVCITSTNRVIAGDFYRLQKSLPLNVHLAVGFRSEGNQNLIVQHTPFTLVRLPIKISLSSARNQVLSSVDLEDYRFIAFPDDDCWYPRNLLLRVESLLLQNDYVLGTVSQGVVIKETALPTRIKTPSVGLLLRHASSAALFVRRSALGDFRFDTELGLGTRIGAGEDSDFLLWLWSTHKTGSFCDEVAVNHPKKDRTQEYFAASIAVLKKHLPSNPALIIRMVRRLVSGTVRVLIGTLPTAVLRQMLLALAAGHRRAHR